MAVDRRQFLALGAALPATAEAARIAPPQGLAVEGLATDLIETPLGLENRAPKFSWRLASADRNVRQAAYRIRAASAPNLLARPDLWDSGRVGGEASFGVAYAGAPLTSRQRVHWLVEVWDDTGRHAAAQPSWFEMGLLDASDWHADWLEAETADARADREAGLQWIWSEKALDPRPHRFRYTIDVQKPLDRVDLLLAGKDHLTGVWVNGRKVDHADPLLGHFDKLYWGTMNRFEAPFAQGHNVIAIEVKADTEGFFPVDGGALAALVRLHYADGSVERRVSDAAWRVLPDAPEGWTARAFDDSGWPKAQRSGSDAQNDPRPAEPAMQLRRTFRIGKPIARARLYATALGAYEARLNGARVGASALAPEISVARDHVFYQVYDVTAALRQGENAIGLLVGDGWYASAFGWRLERYGFGPAPRRVRAQLVIDYADGSSETITTGPGWAMAPSPILAAEIYHGERVDARRATQGWDAAGFDDRGWTPPRIGTPPPARLIAQVSPPIRPVREMQPVSVETLANGARVFDFGQNFAGWARLRLKGKAGQTVRLKFAELLKPDGSVDQINLRGADAIDHYTLAGDPAGETFEPVFTYHGFRYVEVEGLSDRGATLTGIVAHSDCPETGLIAFEDNPLLQKIWHNALWSQRSNFFAVPTDCPQRDERMGWMGDIQVFLDAASFNMGVDPFIRRFLNEVRAAQRPDGAYPIVVPQPLSYPDVVTAGWSEAGIILPWTLWRRYGDRDCIHANWAAMTHWMDYVGANSPDGIWRTGRGLDLGDWLSVDAREPADETTPRILCATAYYAYVAELMAEMAEATGRTREAAAYAARREKIGGAYAREFVKADGVCGNGSQTSQVLSLRFGLVPERLRGAAAAHLAADIRKRGMKLSTGFLGTPYLLDVLAEGGRDAEVVGLLLQTGYPSWGYMPRHGATTMWERWNGDHGNVSMNSYNHYAFGAVVGFFYRRLAGIAPAEPGFRTIEVRPFFDPKIGTVRAQYDSLLGRIATRISGDAAGLSLLELDVPAGARADVHLPPGSWTEGGRSIAQYPDIARAERDGAPIVRVGSGNYRFTRA